MNLIIILSVFICLASVTAQDSSDTNLTIDESSQTDISQITIDDNDYKTESVENSESSANEQNSSNNSQSVSKVKYASSNDKLGVSNTVNPTVGSGYEASGNYEHDYSVNISDTCKEYLKHYKYVSPGWKPSSHEVSAFYTPVDSSGTMYVIIDARDKHTYNDNGNKIESLGNNAVMTYSEAVSNGETKVLLATITNIDVNNLPSEQITFELNRKGSRVPGIPFYALLETEISLTVNGHLSETIDLHDSVLLNAVVTQEGQPVNYGSVTFYVGNYTDYTQIGSAGNNGNSNNYKNTYTPPAKGTYTVFAVYEQNPQHHYASCWSNYVTIEVIEKLPTSVVVSNHTAIYDNPVTVTVTLKDSIDISEFTIADENGNTVDVTDYNLVSEKDNTKIYTVTFNKLDAGKYNIHVKNDVNTDVYKNAEGKGTITVSKATSSIDVDNQTITYGGTVDITAVIVNSTGVSGATLYKDGKPYTTVSPTISGDKITISGLPRGEYTLNATTAGDSNHNSSWDTCKIIVNPAGSEVVVPSKTIVFDASAVLDITGENTTGVSKVEIYKDGQKVEVTPSITGKKVTISGLEVGNYTVRVTNNVDDNHIQNNGEGKITVLHAQSSVKVTGDEITYGETATVSVEFENATGGTYEIVKDGKVIKSGTVTDKIDVSDLAYGEYTVRVNSTVDKNHKVSSGEGTIKVNKANPELTIDATDSKYPENSTITVTSKVDGTYTVDINGTPVTVVVKEGKGNASVKKVPEKYNAIVSFEGNEN